MFKKLIALVFMMALFSNTSLASDRPEVRITTNKGIIELQLNRNKAPKTVDNFLQYIKDGFYTGTVFHRVIKGFMIQGGGFTVDLQKKDTRAPISNEAFNGLKNNKGTIAMARTNAPHSATAQFFINTVNNDFLNHRDQSMRGWGYTVFGKVTKGISVIDAIENTTTGAKGIFSQDVPLEDIVIQKAEIIIE